jgi:hypothetical protein
MARNVKLGDARPFSYSLVWWVLSPDPPLDTFLDQYTTSLKHPLSVGAVQADLNTDLGRPVQARVRQARVSWCAALNGLFVDVSNLFAAMHNWS